jgi:hypothetical protein
MDTGLKVQKIGEIRPFGAESAVLSLMVAKLDTSVREGSQAGCQRPMPVHSGHHQSILASWIGEA